MTEPAPNGGKGPGSKGRATPKRRDAQKQRRSAVVPKDRKEASKLRRERMREQRQLQRQALLTGDERNLPARDAGPSKRLARDLVDSRFTLGQIFFGMILVVLVAGLVIPKDYPTVLAAVNILSFVAVGAVFYDSFRIGRKARRLVATAYGEKQSFGITGYAAIRAMQPRRLRRPPPRVKRGDDVRTR